MDNVIDTGYKPRPWQNVFHKDSSRFKVLVVHRRAGKTVGSINDQVDHLLWLNNRQPQGVYVAPTYGQAKRIAWDIYKQFFKDIPGAEFKEGDLLFTVPRPHKGDVLKIWLIGAENPDSMRGMYLDYGILDEYGDMNPIIWSQVIRPALSDRLGKATFIGTPKGANHFEDIYLAAKSGELSDWSSHLYTVNDTLLIPKNELSSARATMTEDEYAQEYECSFTAALTGAFYSKYMQTAAEENRIGEIIHDPSKPVATFWDLGISDSMAIWFVQKRDGNGYNVIDHLEQAGKGIEWYIKALRDLPYNYSVHHMPHDVKVRELGTGVSRLESFEKLGLRPIEAVKKCNDKMDAINAVRLVLPMCYFNEERCKEGIHALKNYQREWDAKKKVFKDKPKHDWASHSADSFSTFAMGRSDWSFIGGNDRFKDLPTMAEMDYNEFE